MCLDGFRKFFREINFVGLNLIWLVVQRTIEILTCGFGRQVHGDRSDLIVGRVAVQLGDEQVVVFHPQRKLLHV